MSECHNIDELLQNEAQNALHDSYLGVLPCEERHGGIYPQVDLSIWLRSCIEEVVSPKRGQLNGHVPTWLKGELMMNGPGKFYFGQDIFQHLFDGSALVQKFSIEKGQVYYQCRFLRTKSFLENLKRVSELVTQECLVFFYGHEQMQLILRNDNLLPKKS